MGSVTAKVKLLVALVLVLVLGIVVWQNREPTETRLLFATLIMPQAVLLFATGAIGFALGVLVCTLVTRKRKLAGQAAMKTEAESGGDKPGE